MPATKAKAKKKSTPKAKARRPMTTTATPATPSSEHKVDSATKGKPKPTGDYPGKGGKPIEEMTHAEHKAYLIREAEENEKANDEAYRKTVEEIPSATEIMVPTSTTNDDLRAKHLQALDAQTAVKRVPAKPATDKDDK